MSDTGTQAPPRQSDFSGTQPAATPEEIRQRAFEYNNQVNPPQPIPAAGIPQSVADAIARQAREETLAQVAPQLNAMQQMQADLEAMKGERAAELAAKQTELDEANRIAEEERLGKLTLTQRLEHHTRETDERFRRIDEERAIEQTTFAREREHTALAEYRTQQLTEHGDAIMPQFRDLVAFGTRAEVDASIIDMRARTQDIIANVQQAQQQAWTAQRGVSPTGIPASGPLENLPDASRDFTAQEIAAMSPAEYARNRPRLMQAASNYMRRT